MKAYKTCAYDDFVMVSGPTNLRNTQVAKQMDLLLLTHV